MVNVLSLCIDCTSPLFCRENSDGVIWAEFPLLFDLPFTMAIWTLITFIQGSVDVSNSTVLLFSFPSVEFWLFPHGYQLVSFAVLTAAP